MKEKIREILEPYKHEAVNGMTGQKGYYYRIEEVDRLVEELSALLAAERKRIGEWLEGNNAASILMPPLRELVVEAGGSLSELEEINWFMLSESVYGELIEALLRGEGVPE